jgi:hypothetical protein
MSFNVQINIVLKYITAHISNKRSNKKIEARVCFYKLYLSLRRLSHIRFIYPAIALLNAGISFLFGRRV